MGRHAVGKDRPNVWLLGSRLILVLVSVPLVLGVLGGWVAILILGAGAWVPLWICASVALVSLLAFFVILLSGDEGGKVEE